MRKKTAHEVNQEREANRFAVELLMPEEFVRRDLKGRKEIDGKTITELAKRYEVSEILMAWRLVDIGCGVSPV